MALGAVLSWTGLGGDSKWENPLNWSSASLPGPSDDVLLDNAEQPVSYQVVLPDQAVIVKTIRIYPSPGRNIELLLPVSNVISEALTVTGPGYGIDLDAGAVFRNASGLSSGESLLIADSMIIRNGGRYIHQTRASHAEHILKILSTLIGTEYGVFDFDVPKAAYTISVSNRTYGSLELHSVAYGANVNYTCAGANPLLVRGNLHVGTDVQLNFNLNDPGGNVQINGDFIQDGGQINLAAGASSNTTLRIKGDLYQSSGSVLTESSQGNPFIELNGIRLQQIAMGGAIVNHIGFRLNNFSGTKLNLPISLPWVLQLNQGIFFTTPDNLLTLTADCTIAADSSHLDGPYIDGPMRKLGIVQNSHFLFPVGKDGYLRWLELKDGEGNYTVEYVRQNPETIGTALEAGLDHISKIEYWRLESDLPSNNNSKIELSYASVPSGGITDPQFLNVAYYKNNQWQNAGHSATTGDIFQGSVVSSTTDLSALNYTLSSTANLENPLPLTTLDLVVNIADGRPMFKWSLQSTEQPEYFDLLEIEDSQSVFIARITARNGQSGYSWRGDNFITGKHFYRVRMIDRHGSEYQSKIVLVNGIENKNRFTWRSPTFAGDPGKIYFDPVQSDVWNYTIYSINGAQLIKGSFQTIAGNGGSLVLPALNATGIYIFVVTDSKGKPYSFTFSTR